MLRELVGEVCKTLCLLHGDPNAPELDWHFFTASKKFGLRWETTEEEEERHKKYAGEDRKSIKNREFFEKMKAKHEEACFRAAAKKGRLDDEE